MIPTLFIITLIFSSSSAGKSFPNNSSIPPDLLIHNTTDEKTVSTTFQFEKLKGCHSGQKADGLARLKHYFEHLGYYTNSSINFTDDFDDDLVSAVKAYQLNFNLDPSGVLDDLTLKQIERPRCGVPDIINGTSTMRKPPPLSSSREHLFHTVAHYSYFAGTPRWRDLTYAFQPSNNLSHAVKSVIADAFDRWSAVIPMNFTETSSFSEANIRIGFFTGDHGDGEPFDGAGGVLAHAFAPPDGRFHFDGAERWAVDASHLNASMVDVESVAMHEIGHILGMGHSSVKEAIMYPSVAFGTRKVDLASDDIEGIQNLYGANPNYKSPSPPGASDTTGKTFWLVCGD